jgi:hypothetical protein
MPPLLRRPNPPSHLPAPLCRRPSPRYPDPARGAARKEGRMFLSTAAARSLRIQIRRGAARREGHVFLSAAVSPPLLPLCSSLSLPLPALLGQRQRAAQRGQPHHGDCGGAWPRLVLLLRRCPSSPHLPFHRRRSRSSLAAATAFLPASLGSSWPEEEADLKPEEALAAAASSDLARPSSSPTALPLDGGRSSGGVARWQAATTGCDARSCAGEASQSSSSVAPFFSFLFH